MNVPKLRGEKTNKRANNCQNLQLAWSQTVVPACLVLFAEGRGGKLGPPTHCWLHAGAQSRESAVSQALLCSYAGSAILEMGTSPWIQKSCSEMGSEASQAENTCSTEQFTHTDKIEHVSNSTQNSRSYFTLPCLRPSRGSPPRYLDTSQHSFPSPIIEGGGSKTLSN